MAQKVNALLENSDLAKEFGKRNRRKVEAELNLPVIAAQLMQIYQEIV